MARLISNGQLVMAIYPTGADAQTFDPRVEADHVYDGHLITWDRNYRSPDPNPYSEPEEFVAEMLVEAYWPTGPGNGYPAYYNIAQRVQEHLGGDAQVALRPIFPAGPEGEPEDRIPEAWEFHCTKDGNTETIAIWQDSKMPPLEELAKVIAQWAAQLPYSWVPNLLNESGRMVVLPIYMHEHGIVHYSTYDPGDAWGSGQVGFAYFTPEEMLARAQFGLSPAQEALESAVAIYDSWANNEIYGYSLYTTSGDLVNQNDGFILGDLTDDELAQQMLEDAGTFALYTAIADEGLYFEDVVGNDLEEVMYFVERHGFSAQEKAGEMTPGGHLPGDAGYLLCSLRLVDKDSRDDTYSAAMLEVHEAEGEWDFTGYAYSKTQKAWVEIDGGRFEEPLELDAFIDSLPKEYFIPKAYEEGERYRIPYEAGELIREQVIEVPASTFAAVTALGYKESVDKWIEQIWEEHNPHELPAQTKSASMAAEPAKEAPDQNFDNPFAKTANAPGDAATPAEQERAKAAAKAQGKTLSGFQRMRGMGRGA